VSVFRDHFDASVSMRFAQHVGIAEHWLEEIEKIPAHLESLERGDGVTQAVMEAWARKWAKGWEDCWDQLREAREIVASLGRDPSAFDAAFATAGDIFLQTANGTATRVGHTVYIRWQNTSTTPAHTAIAALRTAMPEVVASKQVDAHVDLRSTGNKVLGLAIAAAAILAGIFVAYKIVSGR
jgi:hypothetical protein